MSTSSAGGWYVDLDVTASGGAQIEYPSYYYYYRAIGASEWLPIIDAAEQPDIVLGPYRASFYVPDQMPNFYIECAGYIVDQDTGAQTEYSAPVLISNYNHAEP